MVSTFGSLNTVMRGITAQQLSLNTTGHNLANATTDGFSRQRVNLVTGLPQTIYTGNGTSAQLGTGALTQSIIRCRDTFVDRQFWKQNSLLGYNNTVRDTMSKVEDILKEPSDSNLQQVLNNFWSALDTLSTDASSSSHRVVAIQTAVTLCTAVQQDVSQLKGMIADINEKVKLKVNDINTITDEILELNKQIKSVELGGFDHANDLRDRRDYLVDQLSYLIDIQVTEDEWGAFLISGAGGMSLVTATSKNNLSTVSQMDDDYKYEVINIVNERTGDPVNLKNGELHALIESRDSETSGVKKYLNDLANIAKFLLQEFNDVHKAGFDLKGAQGGNFFGVDGIDYNDSSVSTWKNGQWLANLQVSDALTDPATGAEKLAARTLLGEIITKSNPQSGHAVIGGKLDPNLVGYKIEVEIVATDPSGGGKVTELSYKIYDADGTDVTGTSPYTGTCTGIINPETGAITFELDGTGLTIQIAAVDKYNEPSVSGGPTYTFTIPKDQQGIAAGDNAVNLCNRLIKDISSTLANSSLATYYSSSIGTLGEQVKSASMLADNQQIVIDQLLMARDSVAGVSEDEELVDMIRFQKAYNSASRILTAMDEMLDKLINGTGRVGL